MHISVLFFIFGAIVGSFLNVLILRMPKNENWIIKRSYCPVCGNKLAWYHNVPVLSYLALKGNCAFCKSKISGQYIIVELITGTASVLIYQLLTKNVGLIYFLFFFSIFCIFLVMLLIDAWHKILPNSLNLALLVLFLSYAVTHFGIGHWLVGGLVGFCIPLAITWIFFKLKGKIGLGGGDIKLFGVLGIILGPYGIVQNIFFSSFFGAIIGLLAIFGKKMDKNNPLPFGPFILVTAFIQIFLPSVFSSILNLVLL